jgi:hypothetical protein
MLSTTVMTLSFLLVVSAPRVNKENGRQAVTATTTSISIGGRTFTKGIARSVVIEQLSQDYKLERMGSGESSDDWLIRERAHPDHLAGMMSFEGARLSKATRFWALSNDEEAVDAATRLFEVIERVVKEAGGQATVKVKSFRQENVSVKQAEIVFGSKCVSIYVLEKGGGDGVNKTEVHVEEVMR